VHRGDRRHLRSALAGLVAAAAAASAGCSGKKAGPPEPVITVEAATIQPKTIQDLVSAEAVLYPLDQAVIVPKITAPIRRFYVQRGSRVRAGQLLAVLENKDLAAAVEESKGGYDQAQAAYSTSTAVDLPQQIQAAQLNEKVTRQAKEAAQQVYQSREKLYKAGAIARNLLNQSQVSYVQARNDYELAVARLKALEAVGRKEQLKAAKGQLEAARGKYQGALAQLKYSEIRSPIDGVVTDRPLYEGELATAGTPMITVMNLSRVVAHAYLSPQQAAALRVGDPASITAGNQTPDLPGKVTVVSPALDPQSTTVQVWVEAENPGDRLRPGDTVRVNIVAGTVRDALVVPAAAVLTAADGSTSVMVVGSDGRAHQVSVKTGLRRDDEVQIASGLRPGQRVVTVGAYGLPEGARVRFQR
jgi:HlyD family secretion protein